MTSQEVLAIRRRNADDLRSRGVQHAALVGSVASGFATTELHHPLGPDRSVYRHDYEGVRNDVMWRTVQQSL